MTTSSTRPLAGGTLSRVPIQGGTANEMGRGVVCADWAPDGSTLAVVRSMDGRNQVEFPPGRVLYRTSGWIASLRVSPDGRDVAFIEHAVRQDYAGTLMLLRDGKLTPLGGQWDYALGLAWHPRGKEIWFTAARKGSSTALWGVTLRGALRPIVNAPGMLLLHVIAPNGRILLSREIRRLEMNANLPDMDSERDISWLDSSRAQDLSADGELLLFDESGEGTGNGFVSYLHRMRYRTTRRLGEGRAMSPSPDGKSALLLADGDRRRFQLVPLSGGEGRAVAETRLEYQWGRFFPDGKRLLALASAPNEALRLWVVPLEGGEPTAISPPTLARNIAIAPDGRAVAALSADGRLMIYRTAPAEPESIPTGEPLAPVLWYSDYRTLLVHRLRAQTDIPARIFKLDLATGTVKPWLQIQPRDRVGVHSIVRVLLTARADGYVYSFRRILSELYAVDGLR